MKFKNILTLILIVTLGFCQTSLVAQTDNELTTALAELLKFDYQVDNSLTHKMDSWVRASANDEELRQKLEGFFIGVLMSKDTPLAAKQYAARQLKHVGSDMSVTVLSSLLVNDETVDIGIYPLTQMSVDVAKTLRMSYKNAGPKGKITILNALASLGDDGDGKNVSLLSSNLSSDNEALVKASIAGLGKIGGSSAVEALNGYHSKASSNKGLVEDALLGCAEKYIAAGKTPQGVAIYDQLYNNPVDNWAIKGAAARGLLMNTNDNIQASVLDGMIKNQTEDRVRGIAIDAARDIKNPGLNSVLIANLASASDTNKVQIISTLADRQAKEGLNDIIGYLASNNKEVKAAALMAVSKMGDASAVKPLIALSAKSRDKRDARKVLVGISDPATNGVLLKGLASSDGKEKIEYINVLGQRNAKEAATEILALANSDDNKIRRESIKALKTVAGPEHLNTLVEILVNAKNNTDRKEAEKSVIAVAKQEPNASKRTKSLLANYNSSSDDKLKASILFVLGSLGGEEAYGLVKKALSQSPALQDAAIRAMAAWPNFDTVSGDLMELAKNGKTPKQKILALRGYIQLIGNSEGSSIAKVKLYQSVLPLCENVSEKRLITAGLSQNPSISSFNMAIDLMNDASIIEEAALAATQIGIQIMEENDEAVYRKVKTIVGKVKNPTTLATAESIIEELAWIDEEGGEEEEEGDDEGEGDEDEMEEEEEED